MYNVEDFKKYLIDWFSANVELMVAAHDEQAEVARTNRERQKGKGQGKAKGKSKGKR